MRSVNYTTLMTTGSEVASNYSYQLQPRVDGDIVADTCNSPILSTYFTTTKLTVPRRSTIVPEELQFKRSRCDLP